MIMTNKINAFNNIAILNLHLPKVGDEEISIQRISFAVMLLFNLPINPDKRNLVDSSETQVFFLHFGRVMSCCAEKTFTVLKKTHHNISRRAL